MSPKVAYLLFLFLAVVNFSSAGSIAYGPYLFAGKFPIPLFTVGPININTSTVHYLKLPPLKLVIKKSVLIKLKNSGKAVDVTTLQPTFSTISGGVLGNDMYDFAFFKFFWTDNLNMSSTDSIDNAIFPFIASAFFKNRKYPTIIEALNKRFGFAEFAMPFKICSTPNSSYTKFGQKIKQISRVGSSTISTIGTVMEAFDHVPPNSRYYAYPSALPIEDINKIFFCVTTNLVVPSDEMCFTKKQFRNSFGLLKSDSGKPLTNQAKQQPTPLPVVGAKVVQQTYLP